MTVNAARRDALERSERGLCVTLRLPARRRSREHAEEERQRDIEEAARVLHVAATRARDLLVVSAVGDLRCDDRWFGALNLAIFPPAERSFALRQHPPGSLNSARIIASGGVLRPKGSVTPGQQSLKLASIEWFGGIRHR
jgi:hypothetical protein